MLRSNSKKAVENIRDYIMQDIDYIKECCDYSGDRLPESADEYRATMYAHFRGEKDHELMRHRYMNEYNIFRSWAQGLALGGLFCYYYNRSAVADLGDILEETEEERNKYSESDAEEMLTRLIYREMVKAYNRVSM